MGVAGSKIYEVGDKLNSKQLTWIDEYIKSNDASVATLKAGYNTKNPRAIGYENTLRFKKIIEHRRKELNEKITKKTIADMEEIQEFWTNLFKDSNTKNSDRLKASELLARSKGGFVEKHEIKTVNTDWFVGDKDGEKT